MPKVIRWRPEPTPIVQDMRTTAKQVGVIDLLLDAQDLTKPDAETWQIKLGHAMITEALNRLGVPE